MSLREARCCGVRYAYAAHQLSTTMNPASSAAQAEVPRHNFDVSSSRRWSVVGLLFAASLINYLDRAAISFALPSISSELHLSPESKGLLLSSFFWSYALMQVPIGWASDRFNLYWLYAGTFAIWSVAQGLTGVATSLAMLIGFRVILGIGESIYLPGGTKIVSVLFVPSERGLPSGLFNCGTRMGMVFGGVLIPWLLVRFGWRYSFVTLGFVALLWLVPWFAWFPSRLSVSPRDRQGRPANDYRHLFNRNLLAICAGFFCFDYYWYVLVTWLPDYLVTVRHFDIVRAGLLAAVGFLIFGVCEPAGGFLADSLIKRGFNEVRTRKNLIAIGFLCALFLIAAVRVSHPAAAIACLFGACMVGLATGNLIVLLQCCAPSEHVGIWMGTQNFAGNLAGIAAPLLVGLLIKSTGSYVPGFTLGAVVLLAGIAGYASVTELRPKPSAIEH
ncbi:MAG: MFS transporter [Acidobacteria bacterium]|nr:MFS transporter [Acidobacteriota bacterium]MBV9147898.1 MFS transporter [Acidobacteriota bacterium]